MIEEFSSVSDLSIDFHYQLEKIDFENKPSVPSYSTSPLIIETLSCICFNPKPY